MFTGLVQSLGRITQTSPDGFGGRLLTVREPQMAPQLVLGESVAVNGACLTVITQDAETFAFQAGPETLERTNLGKLLPGHAVNLERALALGDRLGGHIVTGHIDTVGTLCERAPNGDWQTLRFRFPPEWGALLVSKGSVAIDGVSLTVVDADPDSLSVMLIPHTLAHTTLGERVLGDAVNLEFDLLAKHVQKLLQSMTIPVPPR